MNMTRIIVGLIIIIVGFLITWKTSLLYDFFGRSAWAEEKFGGGGTDTLYKLVGVLTVVLGVLIVSNLISDILTSIVGIFIRPGAR